MASRRYYMKQTLSETKTKPKQETNNKETIKTKKEINSQERKQEQKKSCAIVL